MITGSSVSRTFPTKRLGNVVEFLDSMRRPVTESERRPGPYPYYGANGQQGTIDEFIFDEPLVLLAEDGGHFDTPSRGIAYRVSGKTWVNNHAHVLRPSGEMHLGFLCRVLENYDVTPWVTGTTRGKLTQAGAAQIIVPVPPLPEQRRIAEILDKADTLRAKRRTALDELDSLVQSIYLDMFGDPATNEKGWPVVSLREATARIQIGPFGSLLHQEDYVEGGIPLVNPKHIQAGSIRPDAFETVSREKYTQLEPYHLHWGDVVMGRRGEMGRCAIVNEDSGPLLCGTGSLFIRPYDVRTTSLFLLFLLSSVAMKARLERLCLGQTLPNLNSRIVEGLEVPLPPLATQHKFAANVEAAHRLSASQREAANQLNTLFASLQYRAFRGEL
jgi:type I restriction enzyme, S subunit